ncbi:hypothetical protein N7541_011949 [Penicillium brevicompactum]|uniref:Uncharacterized protein n=1 Tax=Penicillium brevicompactum TaxID=5074 RepID=A0A9W9QRT7_PENBR|nr:hypothetical protein N7541_011949 [Penicillium brevicompactum]
MPADVADEVSTSHRELHELVVGPRLNEYMQPFIDLLPINFSWIDTGKSSNTRQTSLKNLTQASIHSSSWPAADKTLPKEDDPGDDRGT